MPCLPDNSLIVSALMVPSGDISSQLNTQISRRVAPRISSLCIAHHISSSSRIPCLVYDRHAHWPHWVTSLQLLQVPIGPQAFRIYFSTPGGLAVATITPELVLSFCSLDLDSAEVSGWVCTWPLQCVLLSALGFILFLQFYKGRDTARPRYHLKVIYPGDML